MKSMIVKEFKMLGYRKIQGKKVESYNFYELCGFMKQLKQGVEIK